METIKLRKVAQYFLCEICDYKTSRKSSFDKHLLSAKHKWKQMETKSCAKIEETFKCNNCNKIYKTRNGLWKHKKKCFEKEETIIEEKNIATQDNVLNKMASIIENQGKMLEDQNKLLEDQNKTNKILTDAITEGRICNNITNNDNNFNMNIFLNEQCKDAIPLMEFVNNLKFTIEDLNKCGKEGGFVNRITDLFTRGLNKLDVRQRPIHCSDIKRETLYIKNNDKWIKDDKEKTLVSEAIDVVKKDADNFFHNYIQQYPDCWKSGNPRYEQYMQMMANRYGSDETNDINTKKVITNIAKEVIIDKDT